MQQLTHLPEPERDIRWAFVISLILKGVNSLVEIVGGTLLLFTGSIAAILTHLIRGELIEDPTDLIANQIKNLIPYFETHMQIFGAVYLLSHGILKLFLVINLLRGKLWAYPATLVVLGSFVLYQTYRLINGYSTFLLILTLFDVLVIVLTWHEYKLMKRSHRHQRAT